MSGQGGGYPSYSAPMGSFNFGGYPGIYPSYGMYGGGFFQPSFGFQNAGSGYSNPVDPNTVGAGGIQSASNPPPVNGGQFGGPIPPGYGTNVSLPPAQPPGAGGRIGTGDYFNGNVTGAPSTPTPPANPVTPPAPPGTNVHPGLDTVPKATPGGFGGNMQPLTGGLLSQMQNMLSGQGGYNQSLYSALDAMGGRNMTNNYVNAYSPGGAFYNPMSLMTPWRAQIMGYGNG